jgi:putative transposase
MSCRSGLWKTGPAINGDSLDSTGQRNTLCEDIGRGEIVEGWTGCLWQGRFASYAMDEGHALAAVRYVELNPVTARLCDSARDWPWSSAAAHLDGRLDPLLTRPAFLERIPDWAAYLETGLNAQIEYRIGLFDGPGYPMGEAGWLCELEQRLGQSLRAAPRGRPRMAACEAG